MIDVLLAVLIFTAVFLVDYLFYVKQRARYKYVTLHNYFLFIGGQLAILLVFFDKLLPYFLHFRLEFFYLTLLMIATVGFTYTLVKDHMFVCHITSRTECCLTPGYVFVKGAEIVFQQLTYLVIALTLVEVMGFTILTFIAFIQILLIMHTPVIISCNKPVVSRLTFGIGVIAAPILYIFVEVGYFFPAVYLHTLMYIFYWLTFADFERNNHLKVEKSG